MNSTQDFKPDPSDHAGVAFHPPVFLAIVLIAGFLARWLVPLSFLPRDLPDSVGIFATAAPFALFFWAVSTMLRGSASIPTNTPTTSIVVRGPYRFSRNPIYLSMLLLQMGLGIWMNSLWFFGLAVVFAVILWWG